MASNSQVLISQLLKAEEEANQLISRARDLRVKKIRESKIAADEEVETYRQQAEVKYNNLLKQIVGDDSVKNADLSGQMAGDIRDIETQYSKNSGICADYIMSRLVDIHIDEAQLALL